MADMTWINEMESHIPVGKVRTRFAPSPTGYMHVGNLRTALYTYLIARHYDGTFILRIEDTDQGRLVEGAVDVIYKTMRECGLSHDEGPDVGGPVAPYVQTERKGFYIKYAQWLVERGHAYYCFCEKAESEEEEAGFERAADPCRNLSAEEVEAKLKKDESGRVLPTLENLIRVLRYDPELQGAFFLYEDYIRVTRPFEWMGERGSLCEIDLGYLLHYMEEVYGLRGSTKNLLRAIALTAEQ